MQCAAKPAKFRSLLLNVRISRKVASFGELDRSDSFLYCRLSEKPVSHGSKNYSENMANTDTTACPSVLQSAHFYPFDTSPVQNRNPQGGHCRIAAMGSFLHHHRLYLTAYLQTFLLCFHNATQRRKRRKNSSIITSVANCGPSWAGSSQRQTRTTWHITLPCPKAV